MRELDEKEGVIKSVQDQADILLQQNHPARLTIEVKQNCVNTSAFAFLFILFVWCWKYDSKQDGFLQTKWFIYTLSSGNF